MAKLAASMAVAGMAVASMVVASMAVDLNTFSILAVSVAPFFFEILWYDQIMLLFYKTPEMAFN